MRSNYRLLQKQIHELEDSISDEELFTSSLYQSHQTSLAEAATKRYKWGLRVLITWDETSADIGHTDNDTIFINAANTITQSFPSRFLREQSLTGLNGHEIGHLLYTDFVSRNLYLKSLQNGIFYPETPTITELPYQKNLAAVTEAMAEKQKAVCLTLMQCAAYIHNILEDIYVENRMCTDFPGSFKRGIQLNNLRMCEQTPSIEKQQDDGYRDFAVLCNLLLQYCKAGTVNNITDYAGSYLDDLGACTTYIDFSVYEDDIKERLRATNHILVILWKYIEPLVEEMEDNLKHQDENSAINQLADALECQIQNGLPLPDTCCSNAHENTSGKALSPLKIRQDKDEIKEVLQEETERIQLAKTTSIVDSKNPGITYNHQYTGSGYKKAADDLFSILHKIAEKKAMVQSEQKLSEELQAEADKLHYGNAHKGIHLTINRITDVPDYMITGYQRIAPELLRISKRLQKTVAPILRSEAEGGKQKYLLMGKRLDMKAYHRIDGALFSRTHLPTDRIKLAVAYLADESGSMSGCNRITHTCKTAIVLQDFCKNLGVPITIYGHSTDEDGVALYSYAEFDSFDNHDCFRIMDMSARNGNRDGAALRFVAERLLTQPAEQKLLIISSDGQPADAGYSGTEAEADLRAIKQEYARKGITIFAAAIGDDKENIKRIYGDHFLDITNLDEFPKNMAELVKQYLI